MPRKCSICTHPKRAHINKALMNLKRTLRDIERQYGTTAGTLQRHKKHITTAIQVAKKSGEIKEGKTAIEQYEAMLDEAEAKYRASEGTLQMGWFREWRGMFELAFKLGMEEERRREKQVYNDVTPAVQEMIDRVTARCSPERAAEPWAGGET